MTTTPATSPAGAGRSAYERLVERFGSQARLVEASGRAQSTVAGWAERGVPLDAAEAIEAGAARRGVDLSFEELARWIRADRAQQRAGAAA